MRKFFMGLLVGVLMCLSSNIVYAGSLQAAEVNVSVTGDLNFEKDKVSTFNESKTISGTAEKGTDIDIIVYTKSFYGRFKEVESYSIKVGDSNLFSQALGLRVGENYIEFRASKDGLKDYYKSVTVNRKNKAIKNQLENSIYIP